MNTHLDDDQYGIKGIESATPPKRGVKAALWVIAALPVFFTLGLATGSAHRPALAQGNVQAAGTKVVPNTTGRDQDMPASKENDLEKDHLLVPTKNEDLQARVEQARAATELGEAQNKRVHAACAEYICAQSNLWVIATAVAERAERTVARAKASQAADVISVKELQDLESSLDWARSSERAAKASYDLAVALFGSEGDSAVSARLEPPTSRVPDYEASVTEQAVTSSMPRVPTPEP